MEAAIQSTITSRDFVLIKNTTGNNTMVAEVLSVTEENFTCRHYTRMTSDISRRFSLQPITSTFFPVASNTNIVELVGTSRITKEARIDVVDVVFCLPIMELESGMVHLTGASNLYFVRFVLTDDNRLIPFPSSFYFSPYYIAPFSIRLFGSLNVLAQNLKKVLFHLPESQEPKKIFRLFFGSDAFHYLRYKVNDHSVVNISMQRRQRIIKYYDTLKSESGSRVNNIIHLRILTLPALESLRRVLGIGIGIGAAGLRPSKSRPLQYCTIGSLLSSIECLPQLSPEVVQNPTKRVGCDGIEFVYTYETQSLMCTIRFSKLPIVTAEVATSRIGVAYVAAESTGAYVGACFHYETEMYEVVAICETLCRCKSLETDNKVVDLNIGLVNELVNLFGSYFFRFPLDKEAVGFSSFPK
jgi:hypothetical protein